MKKWTDLSARQIDLLKTGIVSGIWIVVFALLAVFLVNVISALAFKQILDSVMAKGGNVSGGSLITEGGRQLRRICGAYCRWCVYARQKAHEKGQNFACVVPERCFCRYGNSDRSGTVRLPPDKACRKRRSALFVYAVSLRWKVGGHDTALGFAYGVSLCGNSVRRLLDRLLFLSPSGRKRIVDLLEKHRKVWYNVMWTVTPKKQPRFFGVVVVSAGMFSKLARRYPNERKSWYRSFL